MSKSTLTVTTDLTKQFNDAIKKFKNDQVLVGIPAEESPRNHDTNSKSEINNATLLAINEFGSPLNNIPARHPMATGIRLAQDDIAKEFKNAVYTAITSGTGDMGRYYERAGTIAASSIKKVINNQIDMEPPAPSTIKSRLSKGFKGNKALIVTGQMRNAITYVVRGK